MITWAWWFLPATCFEGKEFESLLKISLFKTSVSVSALKFSVVNTPVSILRHFDLECK